MSSYENIQTQVHAWCERIGDGAVCGLDDAFKALKDGPVDIHILVDIIPRILRRNKGMQYTTEINLFYTAVESGVSRLDVELVWEFTRGVEASSMWMVSALRILCSKALTLQV